MQRSSSRRSSDATNAAEVIDSTDCDYYGCGEVRSPSDASVIDDDVTLMLIQRKKAKIKSQKTQLSVTMARTIAVFPDGQILMDIPHTQLSFMGPRSKDGKQIVLVSHDPRSAICKAHVMQLKKKTCAWLRDTVQEALAEFKRRKDIAEANAEARSRRASFTPSFADFSLAEEAEEDRAAASGPKHGVMTLEDPNPFASSLDVPSAGSTKKSPRTSPSPFRKSGKVAPQL